MTRKGLNSRYFIWSLLVSVLLWGCQPGTEPSAEPSEATISASMTTPTLAPEPAPKISQSAGLPTKKIVAAVDAHQVSDGHYYLEATLPQMLGAGPGPTIFTRVLPPSGGPHLTGVYSVNDAKLFLRLSGEATPPASFTVTILKTTPDALRKQQAGEAFEVSFTGIDASPERDAIQQAYFTQTSAWFEGQHDNNDSTAFHNYASQRLSLLATNKTGRPRVEPRPGMRPRSEQARLMEMYTGMASVNGALQADRGLMIRAEGPAARLIDVTKIQGLPIPVHPWEKMISELKGRPVLESLSTMIPHDMLYLRFGDLRKMVKISADLDQQFNALSMVLETSPGTSHFFERYERQLILEQTNLAKTFGHLAAEDVGLLLSDPFLKEGTDVSLIFYKPKMSLLAPAFDGFVANARAEHPDLEERVEKVEGFDVRILSTPDGERRQLRVDLDDALILSNSRGALAKILRTRKGQYKALSTSGDFGYMRTLYPADDPKESAFLFISDAFVSRVTSPGIKILQARRAEAIADLQAVGFAALLYGWLEGHPPKDADEIIAHGLMAATELTHSDGSKIQFSTEQGAHSTRWGHLGSMRPLIDHPIDLVTAAEKEAYERFISNYQGYWSTFVDPIGVRLERLDDGKRYNIDAHMLPLIASREYAEIIRYAGQKTYHIPEIQSGFQFSFALSERLRQEVSGFVPNVKAGLGHWFTVGALDHEGMWDLFKSRARPGQSPFDVFEDEILLETSVFIGFGVADQGALEDVFRHLHKEFAHNEMAWGFSKTPYKKVPIVEFTSAQDNRPLKKGQVFGYGTIIDGRDFFFAFQRPVIEALIDRSLENKTIKPAPLGTVADDLGQAGIELGFKAQDSDLRNIAMAVSEQLTYAACINGLTAHEVIARGLGVDPDPKAQRKRAIRYLGYEPTCAHGGEIKLNAQGLSEYPLYGTLFDLHPAAQPDPSSEVLQALGGLKNIGAHLQIEGEGEHRGLRAHFSWTRD